MLRFGFTSLVSLHLIALGIGSTAVAQTGMSVLDKTSAGPSSDAETALLRYKLHTGEELHYEVIHTAKTKTQINGNEETSDMQTTSQRHWSVQDADDEKMRFDHVLDSVVMTQSTDDKNVAQWDSASGEDAPPVFAGVADKIGTVLSSVTINDRGQELDREKDEQSKTDLGMGSLSLPLPTEPVAVGSSWSVPRQVRVRDAEGEQKVIKIRELYTLTKVKTGVATLTIRSEPLTPIDTQAIRAQVVQQLSNGEIRFDLDNGRLIEKTLNWDENVVSFRGPNSAMNYRAQLSERLISSDAVRSAKLPSKRK